MRFSLPAVLVSAALLAASLTGTSALAQTVQHVITEPKFETRPNGEELAAYFPEKAMRAGYAGSATIRCVVRTNHSLENCVVLSEAPAGFGFGEAALKLSRRFSATPRMVDGAPQDGGSFSTKINFAYPGERDTSAGAGAYYMLQAEWKKKPAPQDVLAAYPVKAAGRGQADLLCKLYSDGGLHDCIIWSEAPIGRGFGEAALSLSHLFVAAPSAPGANLDKLVIVVPIVFNAPPNQAKTN